MATLIKRTVTRHDEIVIVHGGARSVQWETPENGESVKEIQTYHFPALFKTGHNPLTPPYHWHWYQDEFFTIRKGSFIFTLEGKELTKSAADGLIRIPATARHKFRENPESEEECIIEITAKPGDQSGLSERVFRNLHTYLDDCDKAKAAPSLPQLLLFLDSAEISLAFPGPSLLAQWASWAFGVVVGRWYGGYVMGYKSSYEEYYDVKMAKRA